MKTTLLLFAALTIATPAYAADALKPPASGKIAVAFLLSEGAVVIDFAGPWAVFEAVRGSPFQLYTVAATRDPIRASSGMMIVPDHTFADAPRPNVVVIPAQHDHGKAAQAWIRKMTETTDVTMSVCNGAFLLAATGLLDGKSATAYHHSFSAFEREFPRVKLVRGARFVESGKLATAGGLSSGMDLALRVVERYFGRDAAESTARDLEYQGRGWTDPKSNAEFAEAAGTVEDPVCGMMIDPKTALSSTYQGKRYYFCAPDEKASFDAHPERYVKSR